jgi:hypothetical protein
MTANRRFPNMKSWALCFFLLIFAAPLEPAKHLHLEKVYQTQWCDRAGGEMEVRLEDETRVDCLTSEYAIEFDFGTKWAESIGQALHYSQETSRQGGIVLILEHENDYKYWLRLNKIIDKAHLNIKTWIMRPQDLS